MNVRRYVQLYLISAVLIVVASLLFLYKDSAIAAYTAISFTEELDGWGWVGIPADQTVTGGSSSTSAIGFLHLNCESSGGTLCYTSGSDKFPNVFVDNDPFSATAGDINGWAWFGTYQVDTGTPYNIGWVDFDPDPLPAVSSYGHASCPTGSKYPAPPCQSVQLNTDNMEEVEGWARIPSLACEGYKIINTATSCDYTNATHRDTDWGWVLFGGEVDNDNDGIGDEKFTSLYRNGTFEGWAWSGGGTDYNSVFRNEVGLGWIDFSSSGLGSNLINDGAGYVSTESGDVFVGGDISNSSRTISPTQYQSTYLILADGTITNFNSSSGSVYEDNAYGSIEVPDGDNLYTSTIGEIDLDKITTIVTGSENIYGDTVSTTTSVPTGANILDGEVLIIDDGSGNPVGQSHTLSETLTLSNGTAPTPGINFDGSGTIIVNGDLIIDGNVFYGNTALSDIRNLASVAWVIRGDLTIKGDVGHIAGNFFVIGNGTAGSTGTITTEPAERVQLVVYGLMMAHTYNFQRIYEGTATKDEAAELIIYDGRIITNTPPGLQDMVSVLPDFVE